MRIAWCSDCGDNITPEIADDGTLNMFSQTCEYCELKFCIRCYETHAEERKEKSCRDNTWNEMLDNGIVNMAGK